MPKIQLTDDERREWIERQERFLRTLLGGLNLTRRQWAKAEQTMRENRERLAAR